MAQGNLAEALKSYSRRFTRVRAGNEQSGLTQKIILLG
jgi:hypothetical protein